MGWVEMTKSRGGVYPRPGGRKARPYDSSTTRGNVPVMNKPAQPANGFTRRSRGEGGPNRPNLLHDFGHPANAGVFCAKLHFVPSRQAQCGMKKAERKRAEGLRQSSFVFS